MYLECFPNINNEALWLIERGVVSQWHTAAPRVATPTSPRCAAVNDPSTVNARQ